jgi:hypothetical protein
MPRVLAILIVLGAVARCQAGDGRQTMAIEADFPYRSVYKWVKENADSIEESTGAEVVEKFGHAVNVLKSTKYGVQRFTLGRSASDNLFDARFVERQAGTITDYDCTLVLTALPGHRTKIEVTMTASDSAHGTLAINVELRKSLRGMRTFLEKYLCRPAP